ncbi:MAG TPA: Lrp/AsnC family transcriptional regulator [Pseudonocardiaceae bacterium]|nr:Lrp/AsnC family transcriptional regulator [Pseudonocardiaceae bacterium]
MRHELDDTDRRIVAALLAAPRASWRTIAGSLGLSERTVVRRAGPLLADGTVRITAVPNPTLFPELIPMALRIRCRPNRVREIAATLARRPDTLWVDVLGSGDEICLVGFLDGPESRNTLLLRDLPATAAVHSWSAHALLRVFVDAFTWTGGLLTTQEAAALRADRSPGVSSVAPVRSDDPLIRTLVENGRASYADLADRTDTTPLTARRRLTTLVSAGMLRLAAEVDLALLGVNADALLWVNVAPGELDEVGRTISRHPQVRFTAAITGPANLLIAAATTDLDALYTFLTDTIGTLPGIGAIDVSPILATVKRTGVIRGSV